VSLLILEVILQTTYVPRIRCPQLRYIATSLGSILPALNSHVCIPVYFIFFCLISVKFFDFRNLSKFSINLKSGFYNHNIDMLLEGECASSAYMLSQLVTNHLVGSPICKKFCDLLIVRCPHLEELVLCGTSTVPADIHFVVDGRWPKLRKLSLGDVSIDLFPLASGEKRPFITFLEEHPSIDSLSLSRRTIQPHHLSTLSPTALERLVFILWNTPSVAGDPPSAPANKICDVLRCRGVEGDFFTDRCEFVAQSGVTCRVDDYFYFAFNVRQWQSARVLDSVVSKIASFGIDLRTQTLLPTRMYSFQNFCFYSDLVVIQDTFAKTIRDFPKLRSLNLTIVRYPGDESLSSGAARIARSTPV
jgi:hypothetical protein